METLATHVGPSDNLTPKEAAQYLRRHVVTIERWRRLRQGPPFFRINGRVFYGRSDIDAWLEAQKQATRVEALH